MSSCSRRILPGNSASCGAKPSAETVVLSAITVEPWQQPTLAGFLERLGRYRLDFATVIDVGASNGMWTREVLRRFPDRDYFLVEARREHEPALAALAAENPHVRYAISAASDRAGEVHFHAGDLFGGLAAHAPFSEHNIVVPARTLDELADQHRLKPPFFLKLDTHGFEEQILNGACAVLAQTAVAVIEAYNHRMGFGNWLFPELCEAMAKRGFRCLDFFDPLYRPHDASFWQADLAFARADRPQFQYQHYQ
jgi:FkbM family methyltransferase